MNIRNSVVKVFSKIFGIKLDITQLEGLVFGEDPWDSLRHVQLILELEASFGVGFDLSDVLKIKTLKSAIELITNATIEKNDLIEIGNSINNKIEKTEFSLLSSFESFPIVNAITALATESDRLLEIKTLPFNTLQQYIRTTISEEIEVICLLPWDFLPELDWRTGVPREFFTEAVLKTRAMEIYSILAKRTNAKYIYLPASIMPISHEPNFTKKISQFLINIAIQLNADILSAKNFSLSSYLSSGFPLAGTTLSNVSKNIFNLLKFRNDTRSYKVLVTDLDNVLWHGVISEDGIDKIEFESNGNGWPSYLYQSLLKRLKNEGVLLAAVTRNRLEDALIPFNSKRMQLSDNDFVSILASYNAKSAQIKMLSDQLSIGLLDFVFVDDNDVELEEVTKALPDVKVMKFPHSISDFSSFIDSLSSCFEKETITSEDSKRTELYRQKTTSQIPSDSTGSDLSEYLSGLEMKLTISDVSHLNKDRAVQLINKTNQFNINGVRKTLIEINAVIERGGRLLTAELEDKFGSHGEIVACLIDPSGSIQSFVMSCRVLQRRVEYAFMSATLNRGLKLSSANYIKTDRNIPASDFINKINGWNDGELLMFDAHKLLIDSRDDEALFNISWK